MPASSGFTLLEVVVTVVIIGIMITILTVAFPSTRDSQALLLAQQKIEFTLRDAQKRALQEERDPDCLLDNPGEPARCSDVGVFIDGQTLLLFADTGDDAADQQYSPGIDYVIQQEELPAGVVATGDKSFLFLGQPPTIELLVDGAVKNPGRFELKLGTTIVRLAVYPYGQLERE
ncbi:MAG: prepilin-type N-terminal cleavage/methylation domain-containing protein [Candidatus Andersenbacteria bacterium]